ncbi:MAG: glycosyltransferase family 39 protein [Candidatus Omnitrophica bacterium]|nr:glycosyltransferase family 39 protein [Candidatus Omnitrophota bacterium]
MKITATGIIIVFLLAFTAHTAYLIWNPDLPIPPDTIRHYDSIAGNMLAGKGYINIDGDTDCAVGPGYPLFLYSIYSVFGRDFIVVRFIQGIMHALSALCAVFLAWFTFKRWDRAFLAGSIVAVYPTLIYASNLMLSETLFQFLFCVFVLLLIAAIQRENSFLFLSSGFVLALATYTRSTSILFPLAVGLYILISKRLNKKIIFNYLLFCFTFFMLMSPWTLRNYLVTGKFIPTGIKGGFNFALGSSLEYLKPEVDARPLLSQDIKKCSDDGIIKREGKSEVAFDKYLWRLGWYNYKAAWLQNPTDVFRLLLYKAVRFWYATTSGLHQRLIFFIQIPFLFVAILGFIAAIRRKQCPNEIWLGALVIVYFWGLFTLMFPLARYSLPTIPFLAVFVSAFIRK